MHRWILKFPTLLLSILCALSAAVAPVNSGSVAAATQPVTDAEFIRNGTFDWYREYGEPTGWAFAGTGSGVLESAGQDGSPAFNLQAVTEYQAVVYQELRLPTNSTAISASANIRSYISGYPASTYPAAAVALMTDPALDTSALAVLYGQQFTGDTGWLHVQHTLTANELQAVQDAHSAGQSVFMVVKLYQDAPAVAQVLLDDVSVRVTGSREIPALDGSIAYVGYDADGNHSSVKRIAPDGGSNTTIWSHPGSVPVTNRILDVAWSPDASELSFSSNHETGYSAFHSDVYGVAPSGGTTWRITNPPGLDTLSGGGLQFGKVKGQIRNDYGSITTFQIYIQGAKSPASVNIGAYGDTVGFPEIEVADLGVGLHYVVFAWSKGSNADCRTFVPAVVDVEAGKTLDVGTLTFDGQPCGEYNSKSISWRMDGKQVAVDVLSPYVFAATGEAIGKPLFSVTTLADDVAWSPVGDQILYRNYTGDTPTSGIYRTKEGEDAGALIVPSNGTLWYTPAWLPDGSGFVYTMDHELRQYLFAGGQDIPLAYFYEDYVYNPSVSPDGRYVVFEWQETYFQNNNAYKNRNLWILDRQAPTEIRPLTTDNRSANPDWSRVNVPSSPSCTSVQSVTIQGPSLGSITQEYSFNAELAPTDATAPVTYQWDPKPSAGQGTQTASYQWPSAGKKSIAVQVTGCGGSMVTDGHTIQIEANCTPLTSADIIGPSSVEMGRTASFSGSYGPANATPPFVWSWSPAPESSPSPSEARYSWQTGGSKQIDLSITNCNGAGDADASHTVSVVSQSRSQRTYLPEVSK